MTMVNKTVLVTGGAGFLGRHLAALLKPRNRVVLTAHPQNDAGAVRKLTGCEVTPLDITNADSVRRVVAELRPHSIIHAAANKFVEQSEREPFDCIAVNVTGSQNVVRAALEFAVGEVVGVSSDIAAPPASGTYGLTKALMERLFCSLGVVTDSLTRFTSVRIGNIAWSTGSVFTAWSEMRRTTGVIETTGANARRFFLTGDQAARHVITGLEHIGDLSGKVLVPRMKAARVQDLLDVWVRQHGGTWKPADNRAQLHERVLVGELELPYTREVTYSGERYFVISFNEKVASPLHAIVDTTTADGLSNDEMIRLVNATKASDA